MAVARLPRGRAPALKSSVERCVFSFRRLPVRGTHTRTCGSTGLGDGRLGGGEGRGGGREGLQPRWRRVVRALLRLRPASAATSCAVGRLWASGGGGRRGAGRVSVAAVGRRHVWRVMSLFSSCVVVRSGWAVGPYPLCGARVCSCWLTIVFLLHAASLAHPCCVIAPRGRPALLCRLTRRPCAHCTHAPVPGFYRAD